MFNCPRWSKYILEKWNSEMRYNNEQNVKAIDIDFFVVISMSEQLDFVFMIFSECMSFYLSGLYVVSGFY